MSTRNRSDGLLTFVADLHRAVHALGLLFEARFGDDLTQPEALIVLQLIAHGPSTMGGVQRAFLHRRSTLTSVVDRLEIRGLVRRRTSESDRRSIRLELTARGRRTAAALMETLDELRAVLAPGVVSEADSARVHALAEAALRASHRAAAGA